MNGNFKIILIRFHLRNELFGSVMRFAMHFGVYKSPKQLLDMQKDAKTTNETNYKDKCRELHGQGLS